MVCRLEKHWKGKKSVGGSQLRGWAQSVVNDVW